jgi:hypothetical protein
MFLLSPEEIAVEGLNGLGRKIFYLLEILAEAVGDAISMGFSGLACVCVSKDIDDGGPNTCSIVESIL